MVFSCLLWQLLREESLMKFADVNELCHLIRETSFDIHRFHRQCHLEKCCENALAHRLRKRGIEERQQYPLSVCDEGGTLLGEFFADLFIENRLIVELKAVRAVLDEHLAQLLGHLRSGRIETGLPINFGARSVREEIPDD